MRQLVHHGLTRFRRHVLKLWESRGGGFYGFVAVLTFLYLEALDLGGDLASLSHAHLDIGWVISFMVNNLIDAVTNTVRSVVWPFAWLTHFGLTLLSGGLLGASYGAYRAVRPTVLRLLREPDAEPARVATPRAGA